MLDQGKWVEFTIGDIFEVSKGVRLTKAAMQSGEIEFIGASAMNNGVTAMVSNDMHLQKANTITVSYNGSVGESFFHKAPYWASDDVNVIAIPGVELDEPLALFLCAVFRRVGREYGFTRKWNMAAMKADVITLPATDDDQPDWERMGAIMAGVMAESVTRLEELAQSAPGVTPIDTSEWGEFKVGEVFEIRNGKKYPRQYRAVGDLPLVSTSRLNNGISDFIADREDSVYSNILTVAYSGSVGATFYHPDRVFVGETVMALVPRHDFLNETRGLFIAAQLRTTNAEYSYARKMKVLQYKDHPLTLPITSTGEPDWDAMDAMMSEVMAESATRLEMLQGAGV